MKNTMKLVSKLPLIAALAALPLAGCVEDEDRITNPVPAGNELLARYVAIGNSITAGLQSGGIVDSTQLQAYPVLLAAQADVPFTVPLLKYPGCPPPYTQPFLISQARLGGANAPACSLRSDAVAPRFVSNLAVPGLFIGGALNNAVPNNPPATDVFKTFFLGGRTQIETLVDIQPTFVTAWLGNNDVLEAAGTGDPNRITPLADFQGSLGDVVEAIKQTPARDAAVLIGLAPFPAIIQPGAYFWALRQAGQLPKPVNNNCAPVTLLGQPNPLAANLVNFQILAAPQVTEISCANDAPFLLNAAEQQAFFTRITEFNAALKAAADANNWLYVDPNVVFAGEGATPANFRFRANPAQFKLCQGIYTAATTAAFQAAVVTTCPGPGAPANMGTFFGSYLSFDATHPSAAFHQVLANHLATAINAKYGTQIGTSG